jgi:signal transduction histidine kinase
MPDGSVSVLETSKVPLHGSDGRVVGLLGVYEDITERMETERFLINQQIAQSIGHCLSNWVTVLEANCFDLELEFGENAALKRMDQAIRFLRNATDVATKLSALHAETAFEELSVNDIVESIVERRHDDRITFSASEDSPTVFGSPGHIPNALLELLANACDFAPTVMHGGRIDVWVDVCDDTCAIHVRDNGPGVPGDLRGQNMFELFATSDSSRTGMGLSYVQQVATAHRGSVREIGRAGEGAHFVFEIPIGEAQR